MCLMAGGGEELGDQRAHGHGERRGPSSASLLLLDHSALEKFRGKGSLDWLVVLEAEECKSMVLASVWGLVRAYALQLTVQCGRSLWEREKGANLLQ